MTTPNITTLPTAPSRARPTTFSDEADAFLSALETFNTELNAVGDYIDTSVEGLTSTASALATSFQSTSTTSVAIGTGSKTFTTGLNKGFAAGQYICAWYDAANLMIGIVTSYNISTGELIVTVDNTTGSGTYAVWVITLFGMPLPMTATGPNFSSSPTVPTPTTSDDSTKAASTEYVRNAIHDIIPAGVILLWSGAVAAIPTGWALCDGTNGTPDLRGRFVIAAGGTYAVGATGNGTIPSHAHSFSATTSSDGAHTHVDPHYIAGGANTDVPQRMSSATDPDVQQTESSGTHTHSVSGTSGNYGTGTEVIAKHYALAYIMKTTGV